MSDLSWKHIPPWHETGRRYCFNSGCVYRAIYLTILDNFFCCKCVFPFEIYCLQGADLIEKANGLHVFMNWKRNLLTVSVL